MKVLVVGKFYAEAFALHIDETLKKMGHDVLRFEPGFKNGRTTTKIGSRFEQGWSTIYSATDTIATIRDLRMRSFWSLISQNQLDLIIVCYDYFWPEEVFKLKKRTGAMVIMWFPDAMVNFQRGFFINAPYDALFFKDPYIVKAFGDTLLSPVYYLPEAFNPQKHALCPSNFIINQEEYICDITTAGNMHSWRAAGLRHLSEYKVNVWGSFPPSWLNLPHITQMQMGRAVHNSEKAQAFLHAKIALNQLHYGEVWGVNVRCFEIAGIGAFQMISWRPGLKDLFMDGKELVSFSSISDLKTKIKYWINRKEERNEIAEAGKRRAYLEHTYKHRLELLIATLNGEEFGYLSTLNTI